MYDKPIYWLNELGQDANDFVGKKCANLGEMTRMGIPVPEGFALSLQAHDIFLQGSGIHDAISGQLGPSLEKARASDAPDMESFEGISKQIHEMIKEQEIPSDLESLVITYYRELCERCQVEDIPVAVRSSGAVSMPGQMETYLNVRGAEEVIHNLKRVWASAYTPRAIHYRLTHEGMRVRDAKIGVAILRMVEARCAGVGFTASPATGDTTRVIIEGNWGLGESIVQGLVTPDVYYIAKDPLSVDSVTIGEKLKYYELLENGTELKEVPEEKRSVSCLSDEEAIEIAKIAIKLEEHFQVPQDIEWAIDSRSPFPQNVYMVQARPAKHIPKKKSATDTILDMLTQKMK
jgi:pyruvate,water dikinase